MGHTQLAGVLTQLRRTVDAHGPAAPTDGELLRRFVTAHDHGAFELLVWRHGTMVLHACRRLLARPEDAEDAFQATFLALVRQAGGIGKREAVAGWLHKVACRIALRVRAQAARHAAMERQCATRPDPAHGPARILEGGLDPVLWAEVRCVVDGEVNRLPAKLRAAFVLCCLEGLTNEEAARQLGCPKGTVLSRLSRARERLRGRLARRGLTLSVGALTAALSQEAASSAASVYLVMSTVKAGLLVAAGQALTAVVAAPIAALTEGVLQAMFISKVKIVLTVVVCAGMTVGGAGGWIYQSQAAGQAEVQLRQPSPTPAAQSTPKDGSSLLQAQKDRETIERQRLLQAQDQLLASKAHLDAVQKAYDAAQAEVQAQLMASKTKLDAATKIYQAAQASYDQLAQAKPVAPPKNEAKPAPAIPKKAEPATAPTLPVGTQTDLIQLANAYVDAVRELATAKAKLMPTTKLSREDLDIGEINLVSANRKVDLLKAIVEAAIQSAEVELRDAKHLLQVGVDGAARVTSAESKLRILKLILGSNK